MVCISALEGLKNVSVVEEVDHLARPAPSRPDRFRVEMVITDVSFNSEENMVGTGTSIFNTVGGVVGNVDGGIPAVINTHGYVRADVSVINLATGEIITSFPVSGTHIEKVVQVGDGFTGLAMLSSARSTYAGASRAALNEAARTLCDTLSARR